MSDAKIPVIVLGGTGYVSGELLRLIAGHPRLELKCILSDSQPGESVAKFFAHLAPIYPELKFSSLDEVKQLVGTLPNPAIISAASSLFHRAAAWIAGSMISRPCSPV